MSKQYKGIAVLGSHPATVEMAPFGEEDWLIYACSPHNFECRRLPRFDAWFELHKPIADATRAYPYLRYLETIDKPLWMRDDDAMHLFPTAKKFPEQEMQELFGPFTFTSSIAYMIAMAIDDATKLNIPAIGLWGIMQASESEYTYQRPGIQNLIWEATKRNIEVYAPDVSEFTLLIAGFSLGASLALSLQEHTHPAPQKPSTYCACTTKELWI
jgi:hypothetical protein